MLICSESGYHRDPFWVIPVSSFNFTNRNSSSISWRSRSFRRSGTTQLAPKPWGIIIANAADFSKPPEKLSYPQQMAVACSGVIWSRYSTIITPRNLNLLSVNVAMAGTGLYQVARKLWHDYSSAEGAVAKEQ
ncbi:mitochondrial pyruvate carrier 4-like isoform X1 [Malania oleifera]|uniref:mitochondrial pyruvate carrier 4-like isoform X1 n=1 Tax=Malania oleifera TaxID=397392 RepID=UPI0025ADF242|nr:mitochondrial pyruvate carrier 4-like isoform X1 [Malania oleifera]